DRVRRPVRRPPRRPLLAPQRLEDLSVVQVCHEVATVANIQGGVGDSRSKAVWPARVDEFVARPRPYVEPYVEFLGSKTPWAHPGPILLDSTRRLPRGLSCHWGEGAD